MQAIGLLLLWMLVTLQGLVIVYLARQLAQIRSLAEIGGLSSTQAPLAGKPAPAFHVQALRTGERIHSSRFAGRPLALLFLSTECSVCRRLVSQLSSLSAGELSGLAIFCHGSGRGCKAYFSSIATVVDVFCTDRTAKVAADVPALFDLAGFPALVSIDAAWRVTEYRFPKTVQDVLACLPGGQTDFEVLETPQPA